VEAFAVELALNRLRQVPTDPTAEPKSESRLSRMFSKPVHDQVLYND